MDTLLVGSEVPRVDGLAKVTGKAVYGDDIIMNNMLYGVCRYVDIPAGRIDALDLSEAEFKFKLQDNPAKIPPV